MDALIDPVTRDYVLVNGVPTHDPAGGLANAVYLRLMTPLGSYWADATLGSRLHELQREKDVARVAVLARQYSEQALASIKADGRVTDISVTVDRPGTGWMYLYIQVTAASGEQLPFTYPV
ncbi:MAG: hypothetical protein HOP20_04485, partial [Sulfuriferula sp.]|nr:hypothetical protein [Sulfuriferula sp.]